MPDPTTMASPGPGCSRSEAGAEMSWVRTLKCERWPAHLLWGAGAALLEGPVLEGGDAVVQEIQLPGLGQHRSLHDAAVTTPANTTERAIQNRRAVECRGACRESPASLLWPAAFWELAVRTRGPCRPRPLTSLESPSGNGRREASRESPAP